MTRLSEKRIAAIVENDENSWADSCAIPELLTERAAVKKMVGDAIDIIMADDGGGGFETGMELLCKAIGRTVRKPKIVATSIRKMSMKKPAVFHVDDEGENGNG